MKVRFTPQAFRDLADIADFIRAENPQAAQRVRSAILESIGVLADFPEIGRRQRVESVRKHVTRKYGYLVYYSVDLASDQIAILAIQHPARDRVFEDR